MKKIRLFINKLKKLIWDAGLKPILLLLGHDFKTVRKNMAALVIVLGLCFIPSLYAWINIYACWDPYGNTGNLPVAIVNNDNGAVFNGEVVNVGESIVEEMKENTAINWHFVDEWQANYGLNDGQYYAMIEIPANFSERLTSLGTSTPRKPAIVYRANEKLNAIAAKITNVAKDKLVDNIKSNFVKTVNEQILVTFNDNADKSDVDSLTLADIREDLRNVSTNIEDIMDHLETEKMNDKNYQRHLQQTNERMENLLIKMDNMQAILKATSRLNSAQTRSITQKIEILSAGMDDLQNLNTKNQEFLDQMIKINENELDEDLLTVLSSTNDICTAIIDQIDEDVDTLETLDPNDEKGSVKFMTSSLVYMQKVVKEERDKLKLLASLKEEDDKKERISEELIALKKLSYTFTERAKDVQSFFNTTVSPTLGVLSDNFGASLNDTADLIEATKVAVPQYKAVSSFVIATGDLTAKQKTQMADVLSEINVNIHEALDKMNDLDDDKISKLFDLMRDNPSEITDFLSSPLDVEVVELYEVESFGIAIAPFYTVLAIWVGVLLMSSLLSVESHWDHGYSMGHVHISKMILYILISLVQATVIVLGNIYILGVIPKDTQLMFLFSTLTSLTFVAIIFTLVSVLGNVGKAIAIVVMIFQIAGSGGIYPIETNPEIFGMLQPLWPFTYAISGFREAILGPVEANVTADIHALLKVIAVVLPFGLLKKPLHPLIHFFEHKFDEADLK